MAVRAVSKFAAGAALAVLATAAGLVVLAYAGLQTEPGRRQATAWAEQAVAAALGQPVAIDSLAEASFVRLKVGGVSIGGDDPWLDLTGLDVVWRPLALLDGRLHLAALTLDRLTLHRPPPDDGAPAPPDDEPFGLPVAVAVDRLAIDTLAFDPAVLGEAATLTVGGEAVVGENGSGRLRLDVERRDAPGGHLAARATYDPASRQLDLGLSLEEPEGGVLARLFNLPGRPALSAALEGDGSLDGWHGRLKANAGDVLALDLGIDVMLGGRPSVAVDGTADVAGILPASLRRLAGPAVQVGIEAAWDEAAGRLEVGQARLASEALEAIGRATVEAEALSGEGQVTVRIRQPEAVAPLIAPARFNGAEATATFAGPLRRPTGRIEARLQGLTLPAAQAGTATLDAEYRLAEGFGGSVGFTGSVVLDGVAVEQEAAARLVGETVRGQAQGSVQTDGVVVIEAAKVALSAGEVEASGTITTAGAADLAGSLTVPDLGVLERLAGMPLGGRATITATALAEGGAVRATLAGDLRDLALPAAGPAADLLGSEVDFAADVEKRSGGWRIDAIRVDGKAVEASGEVAFTEGFDQLQAAYEAKLDDLATLEKMAGMPLNGAVTLVGTASGPVADPALEGRLTAPSLGIDGETWRDVALAYRVDGVVGSPRGMIEAQARAPWDSVTLKADVALTEAGRLAVRDIRAGTLGSRLSGTVSVDPDGPVLDGRLTLAVPALAPWSAVAGQPLAGRLDGTLTLTPAEGRQGATLDVEGSELRLGPAGEPTAAADRVTVRLSVDDAFGERRLDAEGRLTGVRRGEMNLARVDATVRGRSDRFDFTVDAGGVGADIESAGTVAFGEEAFDLTLRALSGNVLGQTFVLDEPARLRRGAGSLTVDNVHLRVGGGALEGNLRLTEQTVDAGVRLRRLPLSIAAPVLPGQTAAGWVDGELNLSGRPAAPDGRFRLSTEEATLSLAGEQVAVRGSAEGVLEDGSLTIEASLDGPGRASLDFDGRLPIRLSAAPFAVSVADDAPLAASVRGGGDLALLLGPFLHDPHRIGGTFGVRAEVSGTLADPLTEGELRITDGRYENIVVGTLIRDITLDAQVQGDRLAISRATGRAGGGRIAATGGLGLSADAGFPLDLALVADKAGLLRRDDVTATVSGEVAVVGPMGGPDISGALTVDEAEVRLINDTPPDIVTLDVVEVNGGMQPAAAAEASPKVAEPSPVELDLTVTVPNRLFVRGRGLESEWSGEFRVTGTLDAPQVRGEVRPVRGQVSFAGKTFDLQPSSTVAFRNPSSAVPALDVTAEYRSDGFTARFHIRGPADDPEVTLSSVPELPQDEIVSRILFGRGVARISAVEAAQLAQAVASLSGKGGLNILDTARRLLGVDVLRVDAGKEGGPEVTAGRYLSKDVYVGVSQGAGGKGGEAKVEVEVTPNVSIETGVGPTTGGQVGARWKFDY